MEPLLDLPIDQFFGALDELGLDPERRDDLVRQYRRANSPFAPIYGLLERTAAGDAGEGMQRASMLPVARPEGMSVAEAIQSGDARFAVPGGLLEAFGGVAQAVDAPAAAAQGLIPADDMIAEALNLGGFSMGAGGVSSRPAGSLGAGGRVAPRSGDETPAQQVARLLREGRSDEVTDDLMAQADPQEMYQLYVSGETGMDLPMDEASRMARAREMGFDTETPLYHGTTDQATRVPVYDERNRSSWSDPQDFQSFNTGAGGGVSVSSPERAAEYAVNVSGDMADGGRVLPLMVRNEGFAEYDAAGNWWANINNGHFGGVVRNPLFDGDEATGAIGPSGERLFMPAPEGMPESMQINQLAVQHRDAGDAGLTVLNVGDGGTTAAARRVDDTTFVFDPTRIRSRFARFDPRLSHLSNLNAANIDPLTGAAAMGASQQQQDPLASLRAYLAQNGLLSQ
jgi:hypothetical protein